ncbi:c-type cytochrome [Halomonas borealis]|uniref:c-type cytochrome n=1 Tax=Halomonas borealis TaxID=2508710 RepID=UPI00109EEFEE|nr:c-type cytochrome [Halomonas borealis]
MRQLLASFAITLCAIGAAHAASLADADAEAGRDKAAVCSACHGQQGIGIAPAFPNLAGQQASYLAKQIMDIRDGKRPVPQMAGQLDDYSDQDAWNVAAYYAGLSPARGQADPELVERGRELYRAGDMEQGIPACAACHTPTGEGIGSSAYPALSGQQRDYLVTTLKAFATGQRDNDTNAIMREIAAQMSDRDMQAVASYVRGLH